VSRKNPTFAAALLAIGITVLAGTALADDLADEAEFQFELGAEDYQRGNYRDALEHFLASQRLVPNHNVVFNIASTYEQLGRYPEAFRYFDHALEVESEAGARAVIQQSLERIRPRVAVLRVLTEPAGAVLYLDRIDLGPRGNSPRLLGVPEGAYRIIARSPGYRDASISVPATSTGQQREVKLQLERILGTLAVQGAVGARVRFADSTETMSCVSPCELQLPPGRHSVTIEGDGLEVQEALVDIRADERTVIAPALRQLTGGLVVDTDEPGALVEIDGQASGFTPAVLTLPVGEHELRISSEGYRPSVRKVTVVHGGQERLRIVLRDAEEVVAASRQAQSPEDAPSSVSLIGERELQSLAYPTLAEALRSVRGFYVWDDRSYVAVGTRGIGRLGSYGNRLLVLFDGTPLNDDWVGSSYVGFDLTTDLSDYERIEVVRGPGSVVYGTNAVAGVVNLVPRRPKHNGGRVEVGTALDGVARAAARVEHVWSPAAGMWATVGVAHGEGRDYFFPEAVADTADRSAPGWSRGADGFVAEGVRGELWWRSLSARWWFNRHEKRIPTGSFDTLLADRAAQQRDTRGLFELRATPTFGHGWDGQSRLVWNYYAFRGTYPREAENGGVETDTYRGGWVTAEQRLRWVPRESLQLTLGAEGQLHYDVQQRAADESGPFFDLTGSRAKPYQVAAGYSSLEYAPTQSLRGSLGLRYDNYSNSGSAISPRIAAIVHPYSSGNLKLMLGRAFRAPSSYELHYNDGGYTQNAPTSLDPEVVYSAEAELTHRFSATWSSTVSTYVSQVRRLIDTTGQGDETSPLVFANTAWPLGIVGAEVGLQRSWRQGWMLSASYGYTHARFLADEGWGTLFRMRSADGVRHVSNVPAHQTIVQGAVPVLERRARLGARVRFEDGRWDRNEAVTDAPQSKVGASVLCDFVLSGQEERLGVNYAFGVYNLFDWRYALPVSGEFSQRSIEQGGRTILASLGAAF
jgi:outer membrane receptor protein involved in Fe transport